MFHENVEIYYSVKANPNPVICSKIKEWGGAFETSSLNEFKLCINSGVSGERIIYSGIGKKNEEIEWVLDRKVYAIVVDSVKELDRIVEISKKRDEPVSIIIRVRLDINIPGSRLFQNRNYFGVCEEELDAILTKIRVIDGIQLLGFHNYGGTQNFNLDYYIESYNKLLSICELAVYTYGMDISTVGIGGGFGVALFEGDCDFQIELFGQYVKSNSSVFTRLGINKLFIDIGRYITSAMGSYITQVMDIKTVKGRKYVIVDGGTHHRSFQSILSTNFKKPLPIYIYRKDGTITMSENGHNINKVTFVGRLCTPTDVLVSNVSISNLSIGDYIIFPNSGSYGPSAGCLFFHLHSIPPEIIVEEQDLYLSSFIECMKKDGDRN
ncbi:hypothetical protein [Paenibacillus sp. KN14-4R]|uniref:hypothetical protein n=1 Tax=Paenibacillus sp. KN14-4R TaxID=3445773 RepID=UPI003FA130D6